MHPPCGVLVMFLFGNLFLAKINIWNLNFCTKILYNYKVEKGIQPGRLAQSGERQDGILEVPGSSPGLAGYFSHLVIFES